MHGASRISASETGPASMRVAFTYGGTYASDSATTGQVHVERMTLRAATGTGPATFISKVVKGTMPSASGNPT